MWELLYKWLEKSDSGWRAWQIIRSVARMIFRLASAGIVFESRQKLPDVKKILEKADYAQAIWLTAEYVDANGVFDTERPNQMILLDPEGKYIQFHAPFFGRDVVEMQTVVRAVSDRAAKKGIEVGLFDGPISSPMLIINPKSDDGYIILETLLPYSADNMRPSYMIEKKRHPRAFANLLAVFERMWNKCKK